MLDRIGDEGIPALNSCVFERLIEDAPGRPDEGMTLLVFLISRLFANQHQPRTFQTFAWHDLRRLFV